MSNHVTSVNLGWGLVIEVTISYMLEQSLMVPLAVLQPIQIVLLIVIQQLMSLNIYALKLIPSSYFINSINYSILNVQIAFSEIGIFKQIIVGFLFTSTHVYNIIS